MTTENEIQHRNKGITLIALVITIIVLLILAGVSIAMLTGENGILKQANTAKAETEKATEKEQIDLAILSARINSNGKLNINTKQLGDELSKIDGLTGIPGNYATVGLPWTVTGKKGTKYYINEDKAIENPTVKDIVKVGDYVEYDPTYADVNKTKKLEANKLTYKSPVGTATEHGNGDSEQTFTANSDIKWRVLSVNEDNVELISENVIKTDTNTNFILKGARGYLYAEQELNEACKIYGYGYGTDLTKGGKYTTGGLADTPTSGKIEGTGARSITIDDINKKAGIIEADYTSLNSSYGSTMNPTVDVFYPTVDTIKGNATTGISTSAGVKNLKCTLYRYNKLKIENTDIQNMLFNGNYWLAFRCIWIGPNDVSCGVNCVYDDLVSADGLNNGNDAEFYELARSDFAVRPVINLKSNVIDISTNTEYNKIKMWSLK